MKKQKQKAFLGSKEFTRKSDSRTAMATIKFQNGSQLLFNTI